MTLILSRKRASGNPGAAQYFDTSGARSVDRLSEVLRILNQDLKTLSLIKYDQDQNWQRIVPRQWQKLKVAGDSVVSVSTEFTQEAESLTFAIVNLFAAKLHERQAITANSMR